MCSRCRVSGCWVSRWQPDNLSGGMLREGRQPRCFPAPRERASPQSGPPTRFACLEFVVGGASAAMLFHTSRKSIAPKWASYEIRVHRAFRTWASACDASWRLQSSLVRRSEEHRPKVGLLREFACIELVVGGASAAMLSCTSRKSIAPTWASYEIRLPGVCRRRGVSRDAFLHLAKEHRPKVGLLRDARASSFSNVGLLRDSLASSLTNVGLLRDSRAAGF